MINKSTSHIINCFSSEPSCNESLINPLSNCYSPQISVVIPTLNEKQHIARALECILENKISKHDMEVLLIDGGSSDGTIDQAERYSDRMQLHIIHAPGSTVYKALNIGLEAARGEYFVRVDARSAIPANYIETCLEHLKKPGVECVGGIQFQYGDTIVGESIAWVTSSLLGTGGAKFRTSKESGFVDSVYLGVYHTSTLRKLSGFEDGSDYVSEDSLVNNRIRSKGGKVYLDATLAVRYPAKSTFRSLIKQYVIYGAAKAFLARKYHILTSGRQFLPLFFLFFWVALLIASILGGIPWESFLIAVLTYLVVVTIGSLRLRSIDNQRVGKLWARILATMCIHFAWPIGFFLFLMSPRVHKFLVNWL